MQKAIASCLKERAEVREDFVGRITTGDNKGPSSDRKSVGMVPEIAWVEPERIASMERSGWGTIVCISTNRWSSRSHLLRTRASHCGKSGSESGMAGGSGCLDWVERTAAGGGLRA